ncbi:MAG: hypothetical protein U5N56_06345 [Candidatus Marinimicrobia bacterium]|nr:hypothetical protein [Candidatus Neomarinimicrobiota bacterium]
MNRNTYFHDTIPPERGVAQYLELYYMNGDPDDFEQLIDFDYRHAQMIVRINKADGYIIRKVVRYIEDLTRDDPDVSMLGGHAMITSDMNISIVNGQIKSLILAFTAIAVILIIIFRSSQRTLCVPAACACRDHPVRYHGIQRCAPGCGHCPVVFDHDRRRR